MPKESTLANINELYELGKRLGFICEKEYSPASKGGFSPIFDLVWFMELKSAQISSLQKYLGAQYGRFFPENRLPIALFELEGGDPTSKNQMGNLVNMSAQPALFRFLITSKEITADMQRRALRIGQSYSLLAGQHNCIVVDISEIPFDFKPLSFAKPSQNAESSKNRGAGGEKKETQTARQQIFSELSGSGWDLREDWESELMKNFGKKQFYVPKVDLCAGFSLPNSLCSFLYALSQTVDVATLDSCAFLKMLHKAAPAQPLWQPILAVEIESSDNKHTEGGIFNMSHLAYCGLLIDLSPQRSAHNRLNFLQNAGNFLNVFLHQP